MTNHKISKAIITAAGRGTRFLPTSKVVPKELMPIGAYPVIHYILEECKAAGVTDVLIVVRERGGLLERYFSEDSELEEYLVDKGKSDLLDRVRGVDLGLNIAFVEQSRAVPYGNGAPIYSAREWVGDDDFAIMFSDDLIRGDRPGLSQMLSSWEAQKTQSGEQSAQGGDQGAKVGSEILGLFSAIHFDRAQIADTYGNFALAGEVEGVELTWKVDKFIEKPALPNVMSNLANIGRVVVSNKVFVAFDELLARHRNGDLEGREFELWDAMLLLRDEFGKSGAEDEKQGYLGVRQLEGKWVTTGMPQQMLEAIDTYRDLI